MKRTLQITLGIVGSIPFLLGTLQLINGAGMFLSAENINPQIDNQIRFGAVWFMAASFLAWWMIPRVEEHGSLFKILFFTMAGGGVARFLSIYLMGVPDPQMIGAAIFEICLLALIPWQAAVAKRARAVASA